MSFCGFIDLLGTKHLASMDSAELNISLGNFHGALGAHFQYYSGVCYAASDGAFFENSKVDDFFPFYSRVRNHLFDKGIFFRCSYIPGNIELVETRMPESAGNTRFFSHLYGRHASRAYGEEARLRGIGCAINMIDENGTKHPAPDNSFTNVQIYKEGSQYLAQPFKDFRFSPYEVSEEDHGDQDYANQHRLIHSILYNCNLASMESDYIASKYVSILINLVRSSDFSRMEANDKKWISVPAVVKLTMSNRSTVASFSRMPGLKFFLLSIYDEAFRQCGSEIESNAEKKIVKFLAKRRDCQTNLASIPEDVLSAPARRCLQERFAEFRGVIKSGRS